MEDKKVSFDSQDLNYAFDCGICYSELKEPVMGICGHTYCKKCFEQAISVTGKCPECKSDIEPHQLVRNYQVERIQRHITSLKEKMRLDILEKSIKSNGIEEKIDKFTEISVNSLKDGFKIFGKYRDELRSEIDSTKHKIQQKYNEILTKSKPEEIEPIKNQEKNELNLLEEREKNSINFLLEEYQLHLQNIQIRPKVLPIKINIEVPEKSIKIPLVCLKPVDPVSQIKNIVLIDLSKHGSKVLKWSENIEYCIHDFSGNNIIEIIKESEIDKLAILNTKMITGSTIKIKGKIICDIDTCMTYNFILDKKTPYNYYKCETCAENWICESCIKKCHNGHTYSEFLKNHIPTRKFCNCIKGNCNLPNMNDPKELE